MGAIAGKCADHVVVTSDNPRSESPQAIIDDILVGIPAALVEVDRAKAIASVIGDAEIRDVILLAGKGHETYQETAGVRTPFSDTEQAQAALAQRQQLNKEVAA
jgi:UDP-N-acetylmuramyl tripeptide synthase